VVTLPTRGFADPLWYGHRWEEYSSGYARPYNEEGQEWRNEREAQHEREELNQARQARRRDWERLQHEQQEMDEARREGNWHEYRHEQREAEQVADAVRRDQAHVKHEQRELEQQEGRFRYPRHEGDED